MLTGEERMFLYGEWNEEVYGKVTAEIQGHMDQLCKLIKVIQELKHVSRRS